MVIGFEQVRSIVSSLAFSVPASEYPGSTWTGNWQRCSVGFPRQSSLASTLALLRQGELSPDKPAPLTSKLGGGGGDSSQISAASVSINSAENERSEKVVQQTRASTAQGNIEVEVTSNYPS